MRMKVPRSPNHPEHRKGVTYAILTHSFTNAGPNRLPLLPMRWMRNNLPLCEHPQACGEHIDGESGYFRAHRKKHANPDESSHP